MAQKPFPRLVRHCIDRILHGADNAEPGELDFGVGALLALLATPGAFASIFMMEKYGSFFRWLRGDSKFDAYAASSPDEYFFIVLAMVVTGAVAIWKWDKLIPDRRDHANLAPLPISNRQILFANLAAVLVLAGVLALDANAASSILFPLIVCGSSSSFSYLGAFLGTHLLSVLLASIFSFVVVLAILGVLMAVLPYRVFRACSVYIRCGMVVFLVAILLTSSAMLEFVQNLPSSSRHIVQFVSPVWFLGFCQFLRGVPDPRFARLGKVAVIACASALGLALCAYAVSYRRSFTQSAETVANTHAISATVQRWILRCSDTLLLKTPLERGCFRFSLKALLRSQNHALIVGGFLGLGLVRASQTLFAATRAGTQAAGVAAALPSAEVISVPLIVGFCLLLGVRFAFEIPVVLRANWTFRFTLNPETQECARVAKKIMWMSLMPLLAVCAAIYIWEWGWAVGLAHTAVVAAACGLLIEVLLLRFRKIPFTCAMPPFKRNALVAMLLYFIGFVFFTDGISAAEHWALGDPLLLLAFIPVGAGALLTLRHYRNEMTEVDRRLIFVEQPDAEVEVLDLTFRR